MKCNGFLCPTSDFFDLVGFLLLSPAENRIKVVHFCIVIHHVITHFVVAWDRSPGVRTTTLTLGTLGPGDRSPVLETTLALGPLVPLMVAR